MPFTPAQLAAQMANPNLTTWADSTLQNQAQYEAAYVAYFDSIQNWIDLNGGNGNPFGWDNVIGLEVKGSQVVLQGPQQKAPFNDSFNDVRKYMGQPTFRLYQAAQANQRLIKVLNTM